MKWHKLSFQEYIDYPAINRQDIVEALRSGAHYKNQRSKELTSSMLNGTLLHDAILEPETFRKRTVEIPVAKKGQKGHPTNEWREFIERCAEEGKLTIEPDELFDKSATVWEHYFAPGTTRMCGYDNVRINKIRHRISQYPKVEALIGESEHELTGIMMANQGKNKIKTRPDIVHAGLGIVADLKFVDDAKRFQSSIFQYGYDIQAALQTATAQAIEKDSTFRQYRWIVIEQENPHGLIEYYFDVNSEFHINATFRTKNGLKTIFECEKSGKFPDYQLEPIAVEWPEWMK